jgi:thiol-disulfide isomerase/thioredoxin
MRKIIILAALVTSIFTLKVNAQNHNISANISGLQNDTIYLIYSGLTNLNDNLDTIISQGSRFSYDVEEPLLIYFIPEKFLVRKLTGGFYAPESKMIFAFIKPNETIEINGKIYDNYIEYEIKGTAINESDCIFRKGVIDLMKSADSLEIRMDSLKFQKKDTSEINTLYRQRVKKLSKIGHKKLAFIKENLDNELSAYYLYRQSFETIEKYYHLLSNRVKQGVFKEVLSEQMKRLKEYKQIQKNEYKIVEGAIAPDFKIKTLDNINFGLSYIRGYGKQIGKDRKEIREYIVLDFWGTWCGPCKVGIPKMKEYINKYNDRLAFISIACNEKNVEEWESYLKKKELFPVKSWFQLIESDDNKVSVLYAIKSYPTKIILNNKKNKEIVEIYTGETDEFYNKLDELLK